MSFGRSRTSWRLLSPVVAVAWAVGFVALTGAAHADTTHGRSTAQAPAPTAQDQSTTHPAAHGGTSGDVSQPQPISRADANRGGANGQCPGGPYCSTRDGSASGNGNGGGLSVGKPCAGCVGKADNKNPRGQMPGPSDRNAGYECDTNHGIARTNPAHTGCVTAPSPGCVPTAEVPCVPEQGCVPTAEVPCVPEQGCVPTAEVPCVPEQGCVPTAEVPCVPEQGCVPTAEVPCVPDTGCPSTTSLSSRCGPTSSGSVSGVVVPQASVEAPTTPRGSVTPPAPRMGLLPNTGAAGDLVGWALAGLGSVACGVAVLARRKRMQVRSTV
jgi:hypothetical protein